MKALQSISNAGATGPIYLRFSDAHIETTKFSAASKDVVMDFADDGSIVGLEIVRVHNDSLSAMCVEAIAGGLDLATLFELTKHQVDAKTVSLADDDDD